MANMNRVPIIKSHRHYLITTGDTYLSSGGTYNFKDYRGFTIAYLDEDGNLNLKGEVRAIR